MFHLNIRSLLNKKDELQYHIAKGNINVLGLSETHLNESVVNNVLTIPGYSVYRKDRLNGGGGGVLIYTSNSLVVERRTDIESAEIESILWNYQ